jgi:chromate transporter
VIALPDLVQLILSFLKIGAFTFGGGMVMVAFLEQDVVNTFGWLTHREYVDAIALGQVTPGPIVISSVFIGYKVAGLLGAVLAMTAISLPSFLMTIAAGHQLRRLRQNATLRAFLRGVSPAVVGMILAAGISIAQSSLVDLPTALLAALCLLALVRLKVDTTVVLIGAGLVGTLLL